MTTRNANLLLGNDAAPAVNGVQYDKVVAWYGGPLRVTATGPFDGCTVDLVFCTRLPPVADGQTLSSVLTDADWISLQTFNGPSTYETDNLNPCALAARVNGVGAATRIRMIVGD